MQLSLFSRILLVLNILRYAPSSLVLSAEMDGRSTLALRERALWPRNCPGAPAAAAILGVVAAPVLGE